MFNIVSLWFSYACSGSCERQYSSLITLASFDGRPTYSSEVYSAFKISVKSCRCQFLEDRQTWPLESATLGVTYQTFP